MKPFICSLLNPFIIFQIYFFQTRMKRFAIISLFLFFTIGCSASSPRYLALVDSADNYLRQERWIQAEELLLKALRLEPANFNNSLLLSNLGVAQTYEGRYEEALESFRLGLSISPNSSTLRNNRAKTYIFLKENNKALDDLNKSLDIDSVQEWPLQMKGLLLMENGNFEEARNILSSLVKHFPKNEVAISSLGKLAEIEGKNDEALKYYDEALRISDDPTTRSWRILLKINLERLSDAAVDIRDALKRYPDLPDFYIWRGYLHRLNYRLEEAQADKKIALSKGADRQFIEKFIP